MLNRLRIIILVAGRASRMQEEVNKPFLPLGGISLVEYVVNEVITLNPYDLTVVINKTETMHKQCLDHMEKFFESPNRYIIQKKINGTGGAVKSALEATDSPSIGDDDMVLVLLGDTIIFKNDLNLVLNKSRSEDGVLNIAAINLQTPDRYGRVILSNELGNVSRIVEWKNANETEKAIKLCNTGIVCAKAKNLRRYLKEVKPNDVTNEYYLTDCIAVANNLGDKCVATVLKDKNLLGIDTIEDLIACRKILA